MPKIALIAAILAAFLLPGCGGNEESASRGVSGGRSSFWSRSRGKNKSEKTSAMRPAKSDAGGDVAITPEESMQRDLERLVSREREQEKKVASLQNSLSEGETLLAKEEGILRGIRAGIEEYDRALGRIAGSRAKSTLVYGGEEVVYAPGDDRRAVRETGRDQGRRVINGDYGDGRGNSGGNAPPAYPKAEVNGIPGPAQRNRIDFESSNWSAPPSPFRSNAAAPDAFQPDRRQQYPDPMPARQSAGQRQAAAPVRRDLSPEPDAAPYPYRDRGESAPVRTPPPAAAENRETDMRDFDDGAARSDVFVPDVYLGGG